MGGAVPTHAVLVAAPPERPFTGLIEVMQLLAREAIVADVADRSLDARLVPGFSAGENLTHPALAG